MHICNHLDRQMMATAESEQYILPNVHKGILHFKVRFNHKSIVIPDVMI